MRELLITTGHNSSVILMEDGVLQWGYETERLTGVKSDSRFPLPFLERHGISIGRIDMAYVTHWSPDGVLSSMKEKYWDPSYLDGVPIYTLSPDFDAGRSHHDAHMAAAWSYANGGFRTFPRDGAYGVVVDGFGTLGEHFSVYKLGAGKPELIKRVHGYDTSLGLWYQYATAFLGMKMHEDEYKLLGYEAHVQSSEQWHIITGFAMGYANEWLDRMQQSVFGSRYDPMYNVDALPAVKDRIFRHLKEVADELGVTDVTSFEGRAVMACYVQTVLEQVVRGLISSYQPKHLVLSGGVFYNVKLNKMLMESVEGQTCVYPLAGDQGNALGLYAMTHPEWSFPHDLFWGKRILRDVGVVDGLYTTDDEGQLYHYLASHLRRDGCVNLVRGAMEFGPRALCNTSTIALPTSDIVRRINAMNNRNTVMPMAPVMGIHKYKQLFRRTSHVWRSYQHMIIAMEYRDHPTNHMGVAHGYKFPNIHHTGRPQVVSQADELMNSLLDEFGGVLINTSFNYHGHPIAFGMESVIQNHLAERNHDDIQTAVLTNA